MNQFSVITPSHPTQYAQAIEFLSQHALVFDADIDAIVLGWEDNNIIACGAIAGNVLKSIAISPAHQGTGISLTLMTELVHLAYELGRTSLFLYTKPDNKTLFSQSGFYTIAEAQDAILMENSPNRLAHYCQHLQRTRVPGNKIGAIVMNANPFTLGHRYLVEQAAQQCDALHLFLVKEDCSQFSFTERYLLVKNGTQDLPNVILHEGSDYVISRATFPSYFLKDSGVINRNHTEIDLQLFRQHLAPALGITHRFVGSEPFDRVTQDYNQQMKQQLMQPQNNTPRIDVIEIPRLTIDGEAISATRVRAAWAKQDWNEIAKWVLPTTLDFLKSHTFHDDEIRNAPCP